MIRIKMRRGENEGTERGIWDVARGICRLQGSYFWVSKEWKSVSSDIHSTNFNLLSFESVFMGNL